MSRTNNTVLHAHWNVGRFREWPWDPDEWYQTGNELWGLRFYAGCKRRPQLIHRSFDTRGKYCYRLFAGQGIAWGYANHRRRVVRAEEREFTNLVRQVHRAGGDLDDVLEPADSRHGAILWDIW